MGNVYKRKLTLLERWDRTDHKETINRDEIRRAIAIAQAVDEFQNSMGMLDEQKAKSFIMRRADELLEGK